MPSNLQALGGPSGQTVYFRLWTSFGTIWNGSSFVTYVAGNYSQYAITATEAGASGAYFADMPVVTAGVFGYEALIRAGGSPAQSDLCIGTGVLDWDGNTAAYLSATKLAATGLDSITVTDTNAPATTFPTMLVQLWRRFFKKVVKDATTVKTYADNGTTVDTTQTYTSVAGTDTINAAS